MGSKVVCFFCDIQDTINGQIPNSQLDYQNFNFNLSLLKSVLGADYIIFSLISVDGKELVIEEENILKQYFGNDIIMGRQFFGDGYIENDSIRYHDGGLKSFHISNYLKKLRQEYIIEDVFYADDCSLYHEILNALENQNSLCQTIYSIIPTGNNGLMEINEILEGIINDYSFSKVKVKCGLKDSIH